MHAIARPQGELLPAQSPYSQRRAAKQKQHG